MKHGLIGGLICLIIGGGLFCTGFGQLGWDYKKLDDQIYVEQVYSSDEEFSTLKIKTVKDDVNLTVGENFSITYYSGEKDKYVLTLIDGVLKLEETTSFPDYLNIFSGLGKIDLDVEVVITQEMSFDLTIDAVDSKVKVSDAALENVNITTVNGDVKINNCTFGSANLSLTNGRINVTDTVSPKINCGTVNGDINLRALVSDDIILSTVNGDVNAAVKGNAHLYSIDFSTVNGSKNLGNRIVAESDKRIKASTVNGDISVTFD